MHYRVVILCFLLCLTAARAAAPGAERVALLRGKLESGLRGMKSMQADFVQVRKFRSFGAEWRSQGRMALAESRMVWNVEKPLRCSFLLTPEAVKQWDEDTGKVLELNVRDQPWLKVMYESLASWFRGDFSVLERDFTLAAEGERTLLLTPRSGTFYAGSVRRLALCFDGSYRHAETVRIEETNGDVITIALKQVQINPAIPENVWLIPPVSQKP